MYLQLGYQTPNGSSVTPTQIPGLGAGTGVTAIAGGSAHSLAIKNGAVVAWGSNYFGQLGTTSIPSMNSSQSASQTATPVAVCSPLNSNVTAISAGTYHNLAILNSKVYAWGDNSYGKLGYSTGSLTYSNTPQLVNIPNMPAIFAVSSTGNSSYALDINGNIWAWGDNRYGQLGQGNTQSTYPSPVEIAPVANFNYCALMTGPVADHALAIQFYPPSTFFNNEAYLGNGVFYLSFANGNYFGYYSFLNDPHYFYHFDLGYEYIVDAKDGSNGVYLYDFASSTSNNPPRACR